MDRVNVGLVLVDTIISDAVLSVRCESRAITIWQVIDNKLPSKMVGLLQQRLRFESLRERFP